MHVVVFVHQSKALWSQALDLEELQRRSRIASKHGIAALERAALADLLQSTCNAFSNASYLSELAIGIAGDIGNPLRMGGDDRCGVTISPNPESFIAGNFHQISRFL